MKATGHTKQIALEALQNAIDSVMALPDDPPATPTTPNLVYINALYVEYIKLERAISSMKAEYKTWGQWGQSPMDWELKLPADRVLTPDEIQAMTADFESRRANALPLWAAKRGLEEARRVIQNMLMRAMPKYVWLSVKTHEGDFAIGVSTGTWGGYCENLNVRRAGEALHLLAHTTYYD